MPSKKGKRLPRWARLSSAVAMLCIASISVGLILGWVARGALIADPVAASETSVDDVSAEAVAEVLPMPDVRGLSEPDARQVLSDAGYSPSIVKISEVPSVVAAGTVATQDPVAGTVGPESITLSLPAPAMMPNLTGQSLDEATRVLGAMGAQPTVERIYDSKADPGTVLNTDPATGSALTPTPALTVASAPASAPLSSLEADGDCRTVEVGSVNGTSITDGFSCAAGEKLSSTFWIVGRDFARFKATIGIDDNADPETRARVRITIDGAALLDEVIPYGQSVDLDSDITGALRLQVEVSNAGATTETANSSSRSVLLGDTVVLGSAEAIAALDSAP
jgi:hypothetical protein